MADKVSVYSFNKFDIQAGVYKVSPRKATAEAIARESEAVRIDDSVELVDPAVLDGNGFVKAEL